MAPSARRVVSNLAFAVLALAAAHAQDPAPRVPGPGGQGGPGGPGGPKQEIAKRFDGDGNGVLDRKERDAARAWLQENRPRRRGPGGGGMGPPGGRDAGAGDGGGAGGAGAPAGGRPGGGFGGGPGMRGRPQGTPGQALAPSDVATFAGQPLYETGILRTLFLTFAHDDWEKELAAFHGTDVEVPATLEVDGETLRDVGVRFRGNSSFFMVPEGSKRSFNVTLDFVVKDQSLLGARTLNLLNCNGDASFVREAVAAWAANRFVPAPRSNLVRVVVNGESWGVYANTQQIDKQFTAAAFGTKKGARWKVPANMRGGGGLTWLGDDPKEYERSYEAKSGVDAAAWSRLVALCKALEQLDDAGLAKELPALLDLDSALWFLALDNALLDGDGYFSRASDYGLFLDPLGVFHLLPYDSNEILAARRGPGGPPGGPGANGPGGAPPDAGPPTGEPRGEAPPGGRGRGRGPGPGQGIDPGAGPLVALDDARRPLVRRLLANPQWRARYLAFVRSVAKDALDPEALSGFVAALHEVIGDAVVADTRKLVTTEAFGRSAAELLRTAERRRAALLGHDTLAGAWPEVAIVSAVAESSGARAKLRVVAKVGGEAAEAVVLHVQHDRPGPFEAIAMTRGEDGTYAAVAGPFDAGEKVRFYVEVRAAGGRLAFAPAGASRGAQPFTFEKR